MGRKREHSVCVPRLFKDAARILKKTKEGEGLQDLIFSCRHQNIRGIYAIVCNCLKNYTLLENIIEEVGLNESVDPFLAKILVCELLWGKKYLPGESTAVQIVLSSEPKLKEAAENSDIPVTLETVTKPRYARINTLLATIEGVTKQLEDDEWNLVDTPDSYESFIECVANLTDDQFMKDYHFDDVLVFSPKASLYDLQLVEKGHLILQDKASCLPARLLNPEPGSVVLDMCAAPGIKTVHAVSLMKNKGTLYAVDCNDKRFNIMTNQMEKLCGLHNCVQSQLADSVNLTSEQCPGVKYILVDPSCSGTGMSKQIEDSAEDVLNNKRIQRLSSFQERLLVQALTAFPDAQRVVYSTCSTLAEENEKVIERVLARIPSFQVVAPELDTPWEHRGRSEYPFGSNCFAADFESDRTNGFFVAVLERVEKATSKQEKTVKRRSTEATNDDWEFPKKKKLAKKILKKKNKKGGKKNVADAMEQD